ncbi:hypothetical protein [Streptomyces rubiginosohelvolus]|uniref:hypothetical protein n=1 Tax=Streptomyces rubiginosohelvolus TaxID=67362 RepID=UPI0035DE56BD
MSSTPPIDKLEIQVGPWPTDAALTQHNGVYTLFLARHLVASRAARHVCNLIPGMPYEAAEALIREQCPEFKDIDELLGLADAPPPSIERPAELPVPPPPSPERSKRRRRAVLVAALLPALAASWALGRYTNVPGSEAGTDTTAATAADSGSTPDPAPFTAPRFSYFAGAGGIECDPISPLEAECTDADGMVMSSKAATGPDSTIFTFSYGTERIGLRIFFDAEYADTWARQQGTRELYPNLRQHGRYILWGTDPSRITEYGDLLDEADRTGGPVAMGKSAPLPPRLAALTLGTLGVDDHQVNALLAAPAAASGEAPALMAARMVLGIDSAPSFPAAGDDIVAIAVGIEPNTPKRPTSPPPTVVLPVTDPAPGTGGGSPTPSTPPTVTPPPTAPSTPPPPATVPPVTNPTTTPPPTPVEPVPPVTVEPTPPVEPVPPVPAEPTPPVEPVPPVPPVTEEPTPPAPVDPVPPTPVEPTPTEPVEPPPVDPAPPAAEAPEDDVVILDSAWTVAA